VYEAARLFGCSGRSDGTIEANLFLVKVIRTGRKRAYLLVLKKRCGQCAIPKCCDDYVRMYAKLVVMLIVESEKVGSFGRINVSGGR
jgi:hypothetical protein